MGHKSDAEAMSELTSLMWSRYLKEQVRGELNHEMNAYKAEVVTNHGDGTLTVQRPFETVQLRLKAAPSLAYAQAGDMVLVVGIGDKSKALSNAFVLCKTDMTDDTGVPVYGMGVNLLDNWYFIGGGSQQGGGQFPINHRAQTSYPTGTSYCIDRWKHTSTYTTTQLYSDYLLLSAAGGSSDYGYVRQFISWNAIRGKVVTYSVLYLDSSNKPQLASRSGTTFSTPPAQGADNAVIRMNDLIPNGAGCGFYINSSGAAFAQIGQTPGHSIKLIAVKLELGTQQTLAHLENGTWVLNEIPSYEEELLKCQTSVDDPDDDFAHKVVNVTGAKVNPNLLDNWLFAGGGSQQGSGQFPINHRGQTSYSGNNTYGIDRWKLVTGTGGSPQANLFTGYVRLSATGNACYIQQRGIEWEALKGQSVTYSILYDDGAVKLATGTGKIPTSLPSQTDNPNYATVVLLNSQIPHGAGCGLYVNYSGLCYAQIGQTVGNGLNIIAVKVEVGETQTLANWVVGTYGGEWVLSDIPNFQEEQLKCATSKLDSSDGGYSGFNAVVGKVNSGNPYMRFFMDNGYEYQFVLLSNGNLAIQEYNGSAWTTLRQYAPTS